MGRTLLQGYSSEPLTGTGGRGRPCHIALLQPCAEYVPSAVCPLRALLILLLYHFEASAPVQVRQ